MTGRVTAKMEVVCSWCKVPMGQKPCGPDKAKMVSHGICKDCEAKVAQEAEQLTVQDHLHGRPLELP